MFNMLVGGQVNSGISQELTMPHIPIKPAAIEIAKEHIPMPHT